MAGVLDSVDQRTRLAGHNRLELLMFRLGTQQVFGINVFKVQEVIQCPPLTKVPNSHPVVRGIANMRGKTISVMDLAMAVGKSPIHDVQNCYVIITEYNRKIQGFLVSSVDRIVNMNWEEILPPPKGSALVSYLTAVTRVDNLLVQIIDVEKVLAEVVGQLANISDEVMSDANNRTKVPQHILVVDDSSIARKQVKRTLDQIGYESTVAKNGREAFDLLKKWADEGPIHDRISMVISDVEMPEMDGYTLTTRVRKDPRLQDLYIMLHTSLSGVFNNAMVQKVGADKFIAKFNADELATGVMDALVEINARLGT
jgi:two-component system chemotaxis response regulator CheV